MMKRRELDLIVGYVGVAGTGKSTSATHRLMLLGKQCYTLAHDANASLPDTLPDGTPTGLIRYSSKPVYELEAQEKEEKRQLAELRKNLKRHPHGIHAVSSRDAAPLLRLACEVSAKSFEAHGGERGTPCCVLVDEIVACDDATPHRLGPTLRDVLARRRHLGIGLLWTAQSPRLCHYQLFALSTELVMFRINDPRDIQHMVKSGVPERYALQLPSLPKHHCLVYRRNEECAQVAEIPVGAQTARNGIDTDDA
jgi:hypothetical protein